MAKMPLYLILNERSRRDRDWERFREHARGESDRHRRNSAGEHGKLRTPDDESIRNIDISEQEQPLDGHLHW